MIIESIDVQKAQLDLQEQTRRDDIYNELNAIVDKITTLPVFPSLLWVWTFDVLRNIYENNRFEELAVNDYVDEAVPAGVTLKQIFDKFWEDVDGIGLSMDLGDEIIDETIRDWMRENDFLVALDEDGWLDDEENEGENE
jgi:hypothetical protein